MATKQEVRKRRIEAQRRADAQAAAASRRERRRRLIVGGVAGTLAVAMVASLGAGFLATSDDSDPAPVELEPVAPVELTFPAPGESLTGETPCPATDGSQARTTSFETAPPVCIGPDVGYRVVVTTNLGDITFDLDTSDDVAASLFVTNSRYGVYDDLPFVLVVEEGLAISGSLGETELGFSLPADPAPRPYEIGDLIMWSDVSDEIGSQFAIVGSQLMADTLNSIEPAHPIIGRVSGGQAVVEALFDVAGSPGGVAPVADVRVASVAVRESPAG